MKWAGYMHWIILAIYAYLYDAVTHDAIKPLLRRYFLEYSNFNLLHICLSIYAHQTCTGCISKSNEILFRDFMTVVS